MSEKHFHACPLCYRHAPCRMDCFIEPDLSADRPTGHTTPCDECSKPPPVATADLATALRGYAGDGSIEPVDAPASLLLRAADALDAAREIVEDLPAVIVLALRGMRVCEKCLARPAQVVARWSWEHKSIRRGKVVTRTPHHESRAWCDPCAAERESGSTATVERIPEADMLARILARLEAVDGR